MIQKFLATFLTGTSKGGRHRTARRGLSTRRLRLQCLESRLTLSGSPVVVSTGGDSGPGSLRDAITNAVSGETIQFAHSVHQITLTSGELMISQNLGIKG